jgi:hypothetical protein
MIVDDHAADAVREYNRSGLHFHLVAEAIYRFRETVDPFSPEYEPYIVAGLIGFDMERQMGEGDKYDPDSGFRRRLHAKLADIQQYLRKIPFVCLNQVELASVETHVAAAYSRLASSGPGSLDANEKHFHVGATKILHWIAPGLFIMLYSNVAAAFKQHHRVGFKNTTQPGYSVERYVQCLKKAQEEIRAYGYDRFRLLEPQTPLARLFDKVAFIVGRDLQRSSE